jgi:hypothetical protein
LYRRLGGPHIQPGHYLKLFYENLGENGFISWHADIDDLLELHNPLVTTYKLKEIDVKVDDIILLTGFICLSVGDSGGILFTL